MEPFHCLLAPVRSSKFHWLLSILEFKASGVTCRESLTFSREDEA